MVTQTLALTRLAASTWGASFSRVRRVHTTVVRPAITYGSAVWHAPTGIEDAGKDVTSKLAVVQNRCLRVIVGVYKATPIDVLHAETMMPPIRKYLEALQAKVRIRLKDGSQKTFIDQQCKRVATKLQKRPGITAETPGMRKAR